MILQFEKLSAAEKELLVKAPVLVSVLAASTNHEINKAEKADAIKLAHLKTYTADQLLIPYYKEVEKQFNENFIQTVKKYFPFDDNKRELLKQEINAVNVTIGKLDKFYAKSLHKSLTGYAEHVKKAGRGTLINFIFPLPIPGLTD
jgi:hypothetical protein